MIGSDSLIGFMTRQDTALVEDQRKNCVQLARQRRRARSRMARRASNDGVTAARALGGLSSRL